MSAVVRFTEEGVGPCKRIHMGLGLSEDQCDGLLTRMRRYPDLLPTADAILLMPNIREPEAPQAFEIFFLKDLDRVWVFSVSEAWWRIDREAREPAYVKWMLLYSLLHTGVLVKGPNRRPVLLEDGRAREESGFEALMQARIRPMLLRGGCGDGC